MNILFRNGPLRQHSQATRHVLESLRHGQQVTLSPAGLALVASELAPRIEELGPVVLDIRRGVVYLRPDTPAQDLDEARRSIAASQEALSEARERAARRKALMDAIPTTARTKRKPVK